MISNLKDLKKSRRLVAASCLLLMFLGLLTWLYLARSKVPNSAAVFYPENLGNDAENSENNCTTTIGLLEAGKLPLSKDTQDTIGLTPDWKKSETRSKYFMFNLHSLRFLECSIQAAEAGDPAALEQAKKVIIDWNTKNQLKGSPADWTWKDNSEGWEEHSVSWRSIVISYFYRVLEKSPQKDAEFMKRLESMAKTQGELLSRNYIYMVDHNHGLNNAMALLALGTAFRKLPNAGQWVDLSLVRAEQQMQDNVSADGIQLEQSGVYHFYTLRTFMEIDRVAEALGRPLSEDYHQKLDKMLGTAALMAGPNGKVEGLPYSEPDQNLMGSYLKDVASLNLGTSTPGRDFFEKTQKGESARRLVVYKQGGYSFFQARPNQEIEALFHTRILDAPHAHQDALSVTAVLGDQRLLIIPSENLPKTDPYFLQPAAHNTVQVKGLQQRTFNQRPRGVLVSLLNAGTLQGVMKRLNLSDWLLSQRRSLGIEEYSLNQRAMKTGGKVLAVGTSPDLDFVTAQTKTYPKVTYTRTVARIGPRYLLVWDRLEGDKVHDYTQTFHFTPQAEVSLNQSSGVAKEAGKTIAQFIQLQNGTDSKVCRGQSQPEKCGWYGDSAGKIKPTPAVQYALKDKKAEFLWVLYAGAGKFGANVQQSADDPDNPSQVVSLSGEGGNMSVRLEGVTVKSGTTLSQSVSNAQPTPKVESAVNSSQP